MALLIEAFKAAGVIEKERGSPVWEEAVRIDLLDR
jgi:hypothetical protein